MSVVALLDVNVLIALLAPQHIHHDAAHQWFAANRGYGFATCPLTENGFLRVLGNPNRPDDFVPIPDLLRHLSGFFEPGSHEFWPADVSLRDPTLFEPAYLR